MCECVFVKYRKYVKHVHCTVMRRRKHIGVKSSTHCVWPAKKTYGNDFNIHTETRISPRGLRTTPHRRRRFSRLIHIESVCTQKRAHIPSILIESRTPSPHRHPILLRPFRVCWPRTSSVADDEPNPRRAHISRASRLHGMFDARVKRSPLLVAVILASLWWPGA